MSTTPNRLFPLPPGREVRYGCTGGNQGRGPGHNTVVSIRVPETVHLKGQANGRDYRLSETTWATLCAGVIAAARRASVYHLA